MALKAIFDENGEVIDFVEETDEMEKILDVENDPYWKSPIPKKERKHRKDKVQTTNRERITLITIVAVSVIAIMFLMYKVVVSFL